MGFVERVSNGVKKILDQISRSFDDVSECFFDFVDDDFEEGSEPIKDRIKGISTRGWSLHWNLDSDYS